jgi:hypothetical protein
MSKAVREKLQTLCEREISARSSGDQLALDTAHAEIVAQFSAELLLTMLRIADERDLLCERVNVLTDEIEMLREGGRLG